MMILNLHVCGLCTALHRQGVRTWISAAGRDVRRQCGLRFVAVGGVCAGWGEHVLQRSVAAGQWLHHMLLPAVHQAAHLSIQARAYNATHAPCASRACCVSVHFYHMHAVWIMHAATAGLLFICVGLPCAPCVAWRALVPSLTLRAACMVPTGTARTRGASHRRCACCQ